MCGRIATEDTGRGRRQPRLRTVRLGTYALLLCWIGLHAVVAAAELTGEAGADADQAVEEIIVTGSRIVRRDFFSVSPIVTLDRTEIVAVAKSPASRRVPAR